MTTYMLKDREDPSPVQLGQLVYSARGLDHDVHLFKQGRLYAVQYGLQLDHSLTYERACSKLGEAIMHSLTCMGSLD